MYQTVKLSTNFLSPVNIDKVSVLHKTAREQAEVDYEEDKVETENLDVVPDVGEGELAGHRGEHVLHAECTVYIQYSVLNFTRT